MLSNSGFGGGFAGFVAVMWALPTDAAAIRRYRAGSLEHRSSMLTPPSPVLTNGLRQHSVSNIGGGRAQAALPRLASLGTPR